MWAGSAGHKPMRAAQNINAAHTETRNAQVVPGFFYLMHSVLTLSYP